MTFEQLDSANRSRIVRDQLLAAINRGDFRPGDKLPSESELSKTFGVSRVSIREALGGLETIGLIEIRHGRGSFVAKGPGESYFSPFASWLHIYRDEIIDLIKVRGALDELAAAEAAERNDHDLIEKIVQTEAHFASVAEAEDASIEEMVSADIAFHLAIAEASCSSLLPRLLEDLNKLFSPSRRAMFAIHSRASKSAAEHAEIVEAIRSGDADKARKAAARHLESTRASLTDPEFLNKLAEFESIPENDS